MAKYKTLESFFEDLSADQMAQVEAVRSILLTAEPDLHEILKWNAPNYVYGDQDRLTFNLMNKEGKVRLIFHMGATKTEDKKASPVMADESGLIAWNSNIRGTITFESVEHVNEVSSQLTKLVQSWLSIDTN